MARRPAIWLLTTVLISLAAVVGAQSKEAKPASNSCSTSIVASPGASSESLLQRDSTLSDDSLTSVDELSQKSMANRTAPGDVEAAVAAESLENIHIHDEFKSREVADNQLSEPPIAALKATQKNEHSVAAADAHRRATAEKESTFSALAQHRGEQPEGGHAEEESEEEPAAEELGTVKVDAKSGTESADTEAAKSEAESEDAKPANSAPSRNASFGDATLALRTELRIPIPVSQIHSSDQGPLAAFMLALKSQLCAAADIPESRMNMLSIRGQYMKLDLLTIQRNSIMLVDEGLATKRGDHENTPQSKEKDLEEPAERAADVKANTQEFDAERESVVDFEILPAESSSDPKPRLIFNKLKVLLSRPDSIIRSGSLAEILRNAQLMMGNRQLESETSSETPRSAANREYRVFSSSCISVWAFFAVLT